MVFIEIVQRVGANDDDDDDVAGLYVTKDVIYIHPVQ